MIINFFYKVIRLQQAVLHLLEASTSPVITTILQGGTVEGFGTDGNIVIENASNNHVSKLHLINGFFSVAIITSGAAEQAKGNNIYHNIIDNPKSAVFLAPSTGGIVQENNIYHNHIQDTQNDAILVRNSSNNQIYDNSIRGADSGIVLFGVNSGLL